MGLEPPIGITYGRRPRRVRSSTTSAHPLDFVGGDGVARIRIRPNEVNRRAEQPVEQQIALERRVGRSRREHEHAVESNRACSGGRHPRVVGLRRAARDHDVGVLRQRVAHQELELARLVAAEREPGEVVALDEDSWTPGGAAKRGAQPMRLDDGRRQRGEGDARAGIRATYEEGTLRVRHPVALPVRFAWQAFPGSRANFHVAKYELQLLT